MSKQHISFALRSIETLEFATIKDAYKDGDTIGLETGFNFGISIEKHSLAVQFNLAFKCKDRPFIILKVACDFEVAPEAFEKFKAKESNKIKVPKGFFTHLAVLTVGTARGVLHAKLDNTQFDQFILPTINVSQVINEDVVFEEAKTSDAKST